MDLDWLMNLLGPGSAQAASYGLGVGPNAAGAGLGAAPNLAPPPPPVQPTPSVPGLGALFDPTGGMTPADYGGGSNIPQTQTPGTALPPARPDSAPAGGFYGGSPGSNAALKPVDGGPQTQPGAGNALTSALRGVVVPKPPDAQKVSTPAAPRPTAAIKGGELLQLLELLNASSNAGAGNQALKLPSTLGGALGAR